MDTPQAAFLGMVMDRLQALEERCDAQQKEMQELKVERAEMPARLLMTLHVVPDVSLRFSDGAFLHWEVGHSPKLRIDDLHGDRVVPMDRQHREATMFHDAKYVALTKSVTEQIRVSIGRAGERTTVASFTDVVNKLALREACLDVDWPVVVMRTAGGRDLSVRTAMYPW